MKHRIAMWSLALLLPAISAACGAAHPAATEPSNTAAASSVAASGSSAEAATSAPAAESAAPVASAAPSASASPSPSGSPGPGDWDKWSHEQKLDYMKTAVMPKMGGLFHDFDAKTFAEPKCVLCHGAGVKDGSFKMPNPQLPKLELTPAGMKALRVKHAKVFEFMAKQVEPTMAQLLGEEPYDPKTGEGFGCLGCHTKKK